MTKDSLAELHISVGYSFFLNFISHILEKAVQYSFLTYITSIILDIILLHEKYYTTYFFWIATLLYYTVLHYSYIW